MSDPIDIQPKAPWPAGALSNFARHAFEFDGLACASMEGFLQSLKFDVAEDQRRICGLKPQHARALGRRRRWRAFGGPWHLGAPVGRLSADYQQLLDRAYDALFAQSEEFRAALAATGDAPLTHPLGRDDPMETILTTTEFCSRLDRLRAASKTQS